MEKKKDLTKELLANCFKELLDIMPFEKITIKMITDRAGLIRPTFYKHFQDKYAIIEWIFEEEVTTGVDLMVSNGMEYDAMLMLCRCLEKDRKFYKKLFQMEESPNSFENILIRYLMSRMGISIEEHGTTRNLEDAQVALEMVTAYHTYGLVHAIKHWILKDSSTSAESFYHACQFILSQPLADLVLSDTKD